MRRELNREYPEPAEDRLIETMARITSARMTLQQGRMRRGQHAKATGCVHGVFTIRDDVPHDFRHGIFRQPGRTFPAIVRFSNSSETIDPDGTGAARGMAIKLADVEGTPAVAGAGHRDQDFLVVNHPVFPFATPAEYVRFFKLRGIPVVGGLLVRAWFLLFHGDHARIVEAIRGKAVASPLESNYWSGSPYWLGPAGTTGGRAVKYSVVPRTGGTVPPADPQLMPADYLSQALSRHLKTQAALFDFRVQPQTDPDTMPIEDVTIEWDEQVSPPIPVATLTIDAQDVDSPDGRQLIERCESATFSPWNALAEHRPMGGINRLRRAVYLASQKRRQST